MPAFEVATTAETYWAIRSKLLHKKPFAYVRYGDGEMNLMLGEGGGGQRPDPKLGLETRELFDLNDSRLMLGLSMHRYEEGMEGLFESWPQPQYEQFKQPRRFENAIMPHYYLTFKPALMKNLMNDIREARPIHVGWSMTDSLIRSLNPGGGVAIPELDAYDQIDRITDDVLQMVGEDGPMPMITLAAGPMKCALVGRILERNVPVQIVDLGSVVDFVTGVNSRSWISKTLAINPNAMKAMMP